MAFFFFFPVSSEAVPDLHKILSSAADFHVQGSEMYAASSNFILT